MSVHSGSNKLETNTASVEYSNHIVLVTVNEGVFIELEDMQEIYEARRSLVGEEKFGVLVDASKDASISKAARNHQAEDNDKNKLAVAYVANSSSMMMLVNFYLKFNRPVIPSRLFSDVEDAKQWLEETLKGIMD